VRTWGEIRGYRVELGPRLERSLFLTSWLRVVDAELGRVDLDHPPDDRARKHLP
jgi:hypothetical protein